MSDEPLSDAELDELEALMNAASPAPWIAETGSAIGAPGFIMITDYDDSQPDMYVQHDDKPAPPQPTWSSSRPRATQSRG